MGKPAFHDGRVHICAAMCPTCVFRPANLMHLQPGRLASMVKEATANESCIPCHSTLYGQAPQEAICRGFADRHATQPIQVALRLGLVTYVEVP